MLVPYQGELKLTTACRTVKRNKVKPEVILLAYGDWSENVGRRSLPEHICKMAQNRVRNCSDNEENDRRAKQNETKRGGKQRAVLGRLWRSENSPEKSASNIVMVLATGSSLVERSGLGHGDVKTSTISSSKDMSSSNDSICMSKRSFSMSWNVTLLLGEAIPQDSKEGRRKETSIVRRDSMLSVGYKRWMIRCCEV